MNIKGDTPISALGLRVRVEKLLIADGIETIGDLALRVNSLQYMPNVGRKYTNELNDALERVAGLRIVTAIVKI